MFVFTLPKICLCYDGLWTKRDICKSELSHFSLRMRRWARTTSTPARWTPSGSGRPSTATSPCRASRWSASWSVNMTTSFKLKYALNWQENIYCGNLSENILFPSFPLETLYVSFLLTKVFNRYEAKFIKNLDTKYLGPRCWSGEIWL